MSRQRLLVLLVSLLFLALTGCNRGGDAGKARTGATAPKLLIAPEDLLELRATDQAQGPVITGTIQPEKRADLRAEVSAVVLQVFKENGEAVRQGDLLVRLDDTAIRDGLRSAEESARAARQAWDQAQRQVERLKTLQAQGMTAMQALEDAEVRRNNAQSDRAAADARVVAARQQLRRTEVRAPFDGVASERKVSAGDTAAIGKELIKVLDPRTLRLEGMVSADRMHELQLGQRVTYRVNGYPQVTFTGTVKRIDAAANPVTRQVEVLVGLAENERPKVAGLYAEGRIEAGATRMLMLPESAIVRSAHSTYVWRLAAGAGNGASEKSIAKVVVQLGDRDERSGEYPVRAGLAEGDRLLRNPSAALVDGQLVELAKPAAAAPDLATSGGAPAAPTTGTATK